MTTTLLDKPLTLAKGQLARLGDVCGSRLECRRGTLWLTLDDDVRDIVLDAGQSFTVDARGSALVHALRGPAELMLRHGAGVCR